MGKFKVKLVSTIGSRKIVIVSLIEGDIYKEMFLHLSDNSKSWKVKDFTLKSYAGKKEEDNLRTLFLEPINHSSLPDEGVTLIS